ncbi:MAG: tetratricopeptide repeat protein [Thermoanaerobaculia bacterium]
MKGYSTSEVAKLLGLSASQVRGYVRSGFLSPERGPRGELSFSFQDLVFLRTACGLMSERVGPRRIRAALSRLREQLPDGRPLTAVRIAMEGSRIVVEDGARRWQPESGQILFDFGVADLARKVAPMVRRAFREAQEEGPEFSADDWYDWACELEPGSPGEAIAAYRKALALDAAHADAHVNLGRLLHESGDAAGAEPHYAAALAARPDDATAAFNLGVALEDQRKLPEALLAYQKAVRLDPENADAHFNAASLAEKLGRPAEALRHLRTYRKLTQP